jgi:hypothetical protein
MKVVTMKNLKLKNHQLARVFSALVFVSGLSLAQGALIDFEDQKYKDGEKVDVITVDGVDVTFGTLERNDKAYIAAVGGYVTGFAPNDTPANNVGGKYFVSDENNKLNQSDDYSISFSQAVQNVSLDAYDYRADGGANVGDTVTLNAYDEMNRLVGSDVYTITGNEPDGNVVTFGIKASGIYRLELVHSGTDVGTGIDNLAFEHVSVAAAPEPAEWAMIGIGTVVLGFWGFGRRDDECEVGMERLS